MKHAIPSKGLLYRQTGYVTTHEDPVRNPPRVSDKVNRMLVHSSSEKGMLFGTMTDLCGPCIHAE